MLKVRYSFAASLASWRIHASGVYAERLNPLLAVAPVPAEPRAAANR